MGVIYSIIHVSHHFVYLDVDKFLHSDNDQCYNWNTKLENPYYTYKKTGFLKNPVFFYLIFYYNPAGSAKLVTDKLLKLL